MKPTLISPNIRAQIKFTPHRPISIGAIRSILSTSDDLKIIQTASPIMIDETIICSIAIQTQLGITEIIDRITRVVIEGIADRDIAAIVSIIGMSGEEIIVDSMINASGNQDYSQTSNTKELRSPALAGGRI